MCTFSGSVRYEVPSQKLRVPGTDVVREKSVRIGGPHGCAVPARNLCASAQRAINMSAQGNALGLQIRVMVKPLQGGTNCGCDFIRPNVVTLCRPVEALDLT